MRRRALVSSHVTVSSFANRRASSGLGFRAGDVVFREIENNAGGG